MKPVIAIPQMGNDLFRKFMKSKYVKSLEDAGAQVRWIELDPPRIAAQEACLCDGLLLPGGADIEPLLYGRVREAQCGKPNLLRDAAETEIFKAFLKTGKPILGICRGMQMINVCMGGTLQQDIVSKQQVKHSDFSSSSTGIHHCRIEGKSKLAAILGEEDVFVNSLHHQAIGKLGAELKVSAMSSDGFIEGIELENHAFCIGVQWHPEHMYAKNPLQRKIFRTFINAC